VNDDSLSFGAGFQTSAPRATPADFVPQQRHLRGRKLADQIDRLQSQDGAIEHPANDRHATLIVELGR
jgi:hypothetical protein